MTHEAVNNGVLDKAFFHAKNTLTATLRSGLAVGAIAHIAAANLPLLQGYMRTMALVDGAAPIEQILTKIGESRRPLRSHNQRYQKGEPNRLGARGFNVYFVE